MAKEKSNYTTITMVERGLQIMNQLFLAEDAMGVTEISQKLDLPKATVYRILNTLQQKNFIKKDEKTDKYELGLIFIQYGEKVKSKLNLKTIAKPFMKNLAEAIGESVNLGIYHEGNVITIYSEEGESSVLVSKLIPVSPLYCSSMGKIFLSTMTKEKIKSYFDTNKIQERTMNTITKYEDFMKEREDILRDVLSYDNEEYEYGLTCIACPIKNKEENIIAALSISGPTSRLKFKEMDDLIKEIRKTVDAISEQIKKTHL
ncbi:MAG: IclR family transcriptional regulator [Marinisporobacter sp.]|jgi:IclR family KDG regulon transcriptional repressor|nr:IclR family transcriptional regulator [Marinisporobacter sp.]